MFHSDNSGVSWSKRLLFSLVILGIFFVIASARNDHMTLDIGEKRFILTGGRTTINVGFADIVTMNCLESVDYGTCLDGTTRGVLSGTWENELWGKYTLCVKSSIKSSIVMQLTSGKTIVFNYENNETTVSLYESLYGYLVELGYPVERG